MSSAIISGEYITFKHIKTRKVVVLEIEIPEENFERVISTLGMPIGGESKPVAVALLDLKKDFDKKCDKTEGEKLRIKAVMLCKQQDFQEFILDIFAPQLPDRELNARQIIYELCSIKSRSDLTIDIKAQNKFHELLSQYESWKLGRQYNDNLSR